MPKTEHFEWPYPESGDEADVPADMAALADAIEADLHGLDVTEIGSAGVGDAGKVIVVDAAGVPQLIAVKGDATLADDGTLSLATDSVGANEIVAKGVGNAELDDEAVSLGKLAKALGLNTERIADGAVTSRKYKPTVGLKRASETLALASGAGYVDVPGTTLEITPDVTSYLEITLAGSTTAAGVGAETHVTISFDGVDQPYDVARGNGGATDAYQQLSGSQVYRFELSKGVKHTIKMRAKGSGGNLSVATNSSYLYELVAA